jgi:hypothetical protein
MWKLNYEIMLRIIQGAKGMFVNYVYSLFVLMVFSQLSGDALTIYGFMLPYIIIGIALSEGMEAAILNTVSNDAASPIGLYLIFQLLLAALYGLVGAALPRPPFLDVYNWRLISESLVASYSLYIMSAGLRGLLRARFAIKSISRVNLSMLLLLVMGVAWQVIEGELTIARWAAMVIVLAFLEFVLFLLLVVVYKWRWWGGELKWRPLSRYLGSASPIVLTWFVVAIDRHWLNWILSGWDSAYVGVLGGWFQIKPIFLFPAIAIGQMLITYWNSDPGGKTVRWFRRVAPVIATCFFCYIVMITCASTHIDGLVFIMAPHLEGVIQRLHWVVFIDALMIPVLAMIVISRMLLESEKKGWFSCFLMIVSVIVSRGLLMVLSLSTTSMVVLAGSFIVQTACLVGIPIYLLFYFKKNSMRHAPSI